MMRQALAVSLAALAISVPAHAGSGMAPATRIGVDFRIVIPAFVRVKAVVHPDELQVTQADVARGYVDVDEGSSLQLTSNSPQGYTVGVEFERALLSRVEVRMPRFNGIVVDRALRVGYRLHLNPDAGAGNYRWPVGLTFGVQTV